VVAGKQYARADIVRMWQRRQSHPAVAARLGLPHLEILGVLRLPVGILIEHRTEAQCQAVVVALTVSGVCCSSHQ
jgi:hypothetical protein